MFLRRAFSLCKLPRLHYSTAAEPTSTKLTDFRTLEADPTKHDAKHLGRFYTISPEVKDRLFQYGGLTKTYALQAKTFAELCIMVREPAIEIIDILNRTNFNKPTNRFVLYGRDGAGRSMTLAHLIHYGFVNDFILVHVPWVGDWFRHPKESSNHLTREGFIGINLDVAAWLVHFKSQNAHILAKLDLKCSREYVWSKREITPKGAPLMEIVDHGINRVMFATDVVSVLLDELKSQSTEGKCKTMVAIDGYNAFFHEHTQIRGDFRVRISPQQVTITEPFVNVTKPDWNNGVCILVADRIAIDEERWESEMPLSLLRRTGFEHLDPFVPIRVGYYNAQEFDNCYEYYLDRKWISHGTEEVKKELDFISGRAPYDLMVACNTL